jgi:hypothetical protein
MTAVNPYHLRELCEDCHLGDWVVYNIGYPEDSHQHTIRLCERHYRQTEHAARHFELSLRTE